MRMHVDGLDLLAVDGDGQGADEPCACARSSRPQLQKTIPVAAAVPPLRKFRRVVMGRPSEDWAGVFAGASRSLARRASRNGRREDHYVICKSVSGASDRPGVTPP